MDLFNAGVMQGLINAASFMNAADGAIGVYRQAKAEGDSGLMGRALGYVSGALGAADRFREQVQASLEAAQQYEEAQAQAEQEAALAGQQAQDAAKVEAAASDTVEISPEAMQAAAAAADGSAADPVAVSASVPSAEGAVAKTPIPAAQTVVYTSQAVAVPAVPVSAQPAVSVTA